MKLPSLDTAEGIVVLAVTGVVIYAAYRAYRLGAGIADGIGDTLQGTIQTFEDIGSAVKHAVDPEAAHTASDNMQAVGDTGIDGTESWPLPGLGSDSTIGSEPQHYSPSSMLTGDELVEELNDGI